VSCADQVFQPPGPGLHRLQPGDHAAFGTDRQQPRPGRRAGRRRASRSAATLRRSPRPPRRGWPAGRGVGGWTGRCRPAASRDLLRAGGPAGRRVPTRPVTISSTPAARAAAAAANAVGFTPPPSERAQRLLPHPIRRAQVRRPY
jgi:hypothetical protein